MTAPAPLYVQTAFENGSPANWEEIEPGTLLIQPPFDYERGSRNRQLTHWHFKLYGTRGQTVKIRIPPAQNIYGGRKVNAFAPRVGTQFSPDGQEWSPLTFEMTPDQGLEAALVLPADEVSFSRIEPYTTRHLGELLDRVSRDSRARVEIIGTTVEGRSLEMLSLSAGPGRPGALIRGRAHPWEAGGSWFIDGVVERALADPSILAALDLHVLPMAGKDGVVRGQTRFNLNGCDLNRNFVADFAAANRLAPENLALHGWLERRRQAGTLPAFAMDLHDDDHGNLHAGDLDRDPGFRRRMEKLDSLMRQHTYYREKMEKGIGATTFGEGLRNLFGIDSVVYELNSNWLPAAEAVPNSRIWKTFGAQFAQVLREFVPLAAKRG